MKKFIAVSLVDELFAQTRLSPQATKMTQHILNAGRQASIQQCSAKRFPALPCFIVPRVHSSKVRLL